MGREFFIFSAGGTVTNSAPGTSVTLGVGVDDTPGLNDRDTTFYGVLQDVGTGQIGLAKLGDDMLTLSGSNTYSGQTLVEDGTITVASGGSICNSAVELAGGQVIDGPSATSVATTVTLTSSTGDPTNPSVYGDSVTFTATVSPTNSGYGTPTDSVVFYDEATGSESDPITLDTNGCATWTPSSPLGAGDHYIVATYTSNSNTFVGGTVGEFDQTVNPAGTTTTVSIADTTNTQDGSNPGYGDQFTITATVSPTTTGGAVPAVDENNNPETVDFYDTVTGQYLGQGNLVPKNDGSGAATATWTGYAENWNGFPGDTPSYNLGVGGYSIIAVYSGDANFTGSQSSGTAMNVVGDPISITNAVVGDYFCYSVVYEGDDGVLEGDVCGLDGAGYTLNVNWGDGQGGSSDTQTFSFPKGGAFSVCHYYLLNDAAGAATQTDSVTATVTASDGPNATTTRTATTNVTATIVNIAPTVSIVVENPPAGGLGSVPSSQTFTVDAVVSDPGQAAGENEQYSYQWYDRGVAIGTGSSATVTAGDLISALDSVTVTDGHGGQAVAWGYSPPPPEPVVSISETDPNQTVLGGTDADFDIHIDAGTAGPDANMTFSYSTVDPSGGPTAYTSTDGPKEVTLWVGEYNESAGGDWYADIPVSVDTTPGIDDGSRPAVTVVLGNCNLCQFASGGSTATATIDEPQLGVVVTQGSTILATVTAGSSPVSVQLGERISLMACVNGTEVELPADVDWLFPGNNAAIGSYDPTLANNQLTELPGVPGVGSEAGENIISGCSNVTFEFAAGGAQDVTLEVDGVSLTVPFTVLVPDNVSAKGTPSVAKVKDIGDVAKILTTEGTFLQGSGTSGHADVQMVPLAYRATTPTGPNGWRYCFFQVVTGSSGFITVPFGTKSADAPGVYRPVPGQTGLDLGFPYPATFDAAGTRIYTGGGVSSVKTEITTYLVCQPIQNGVPIGGCIPLLALSWTCNISVGWAKGAAWPTVVNTPVLTAGMLTQPPGGGAPYYAFQQVSAANEFPTWSQLSSTEYVEWTTGKKLSGYTGP